MRRRIASIAMDDARILSQSTNPSRFRFSGMTADVLSNLKVE